MKKLATIFMALIFALFMSSCGSDDKKEAGASCATPGALKCSSPTMVQKCDKKTLVWTDFQKCKPDQVCQAGKCVAKTGGSIGGDSGNDGDTGSTGGDSDAVGDSGDCVPDCEGKICGPDGCGGFCGECEDRETRCNAEQNACVPYECVGISVGDFGVDPEFTAYRGLVTEGLDSAVQDLVQIEFYFDENGSTLKAGTYDLSTKINSDYATCEQCVRVFEDVTEESIGKTYFQQKGTLEITEIKEGTFEAKGVLSSVRLVEATIDNSYHSTPILGGSCLEIETGGWDTICVPNCEGKICGPDGCGGFCGECEDRETQCNAEQNACVPYECVEVALGEDLKIDPDAILEGVYVYKGGYTPGTGAELDDVFDLQLYEAVNDGETYDLSLGKNSNFKTCDQCLLVWEDLNEKAETIDKIYFQQKGKLEISAFDSKKGDITGSLSDVRLIEVTIDDSYNSIPVPGGSCIAIPNDEIKYAKP